MRGEKAPGNRWRSGCNLQRAGFQACLRFLLGAVLLVSCGAASRAQGIPPELGEFLRANAHFSEAELRDLAAGKPVAKMLDTQSKKEVAGVGAIRIHVPREFFLSEFEDIVRFKKEQVKPAPDIGKFSAPPQLADLDGLSLPHGDIESLRNCRPGACGLKLPAEAITRMRDEMQGPEGGSKKSANRLFREFLLARVQSYLQSGDAGLAAYDDKGSPVSLVSGFRQLLAQLPYLSRHAPRLSECLGRFPRCDSEVRGFLYWSKEKFRRGLQAVISVTQVMIVHEGAGADGWTWEASKQLYADHYMECSLGLTLLVAANGEEKKPSFYFVYLNATRSDALGGAVAPLVRNFVQSGAHDAMIDRLERVRKQIESNWAARTSTKEPERSRGANAPAR